MKQFVIVLIAIISFSSLFVLAPSVQFFYSSSGATQEQEVSPIQAKWLVGETKEPICPEIVPASWREAHNIADTVIDASPLCLPDNPYEIAAFAQGTNNIRMSALMNTRLSSDAVVKTNDRDGDGDPDDIHIRLEVIELNGLAKDGQSLTTQYAIGPGIKPGFWVFAPKTRGMSTISPEIQKAQSILRMPSPAIRVEQGDRVRITLENSHYLPHSLHLHGVDHPFQDENGEGNDGVPMISEAMLLPGESHTYDITPRHAGTMFYHCHVQPQSHILMGLNGLFIIEENRPNNFVQTFNIGSGHVRHRSQAITEKFDREYDLHYQDVESKLGAIIQNNSTAREVAKQMNRIYKVHKRQPDYFMLNGKSFPHTIRDALVVVAPDEKIKLRVLNSGAEGISLHLHGHKPTITHLDGVPLDENAQITRDVVWLSSSQRADLTLDTTNDGLHSYGDGVWLAHDHAEKAVTSNGINPGGDVSMVVYENYLGPTGIPKTAHDISRFFDPDYYSGKLPIFMYMGPDENIETTVPSPVWKTYLFFLLLGVFICSLFLLLKHALISKQAN
ncbi:MAG: multicopper oxidase domain-containing protein [Methylophagaceae bacterium]